MSTSGGKPKRDHTVNLNGTSVRIPALAVTAGRKTPAGNWGRFATCGPVVDLCHGPEALLRERLKMMQESGKVTFAAS